MMDGGLDSTVELRLCRFRDHDMTSTRFNPLAGVFPHPAPETGRQ